MATYIGLRGLFNDSDLQNRCEAAVVIAALALLTKADSTADEKLLAFKVFNNTTKYAAHAKLAYLASHKDDTVTALNSVKDVELQAFVDAITPALVGV